MSVLIIDDDPIVLEVGTQLLEDRYTVYTAENYSRGINKVIEKKPKVIVVDINLGGEKNGFDIIKEIRSNRKRYNNPMILVLTNYTNIKFRINGLRIGGDDYLCKPFDKEEFELRVVSLYNKNRIPVEKCKYYSLEVNLQKREVKYKGEEIKLNKKEYGILIYFLKNKGVVLSRSKIYEKVWKKVYPDGTRVVDVNITRLKKKLPILKNRIKTVVGIGYQLKR